MWALHLSKWWSGPSSMTTFFGGARFTFGFLTSHFRIILHLASVDLILKDCMSFGGGDDVLLMT